VTRPPPTGKLITSAPLAASQIRTVRSRAAVAIRVPSALNRALSSQSLCPLRVRASLPSRTVHTCATFDELAVSRRPPAGSNSSHGV
jgi:hypothetical protein